MTLLRALTFRDFALLWTGQGISRLGDAIYRIVIIWWVLEKTGSATAVGILVISSTLPTLLLLLLGGVEVDRFARARVMLVCDLVRGAAVTAVTLLAFANALEVWHLYLVNIILGITAAFFRPAYIALLPEITPPETLNSANSLTVVAGHLGMVLGSLLGAALVTAGATGLSFALNAVSFFIAAGFLIPLFSRPAPPRAQASQTFKGILSNLRAGFRAVFKRDWLWVTILITSLANIRQDGAITVALPFLIRENLKANVDALALLYSMISIGSLLAALWFGRIPRIHHRGVVVYGAWIIGGLMLILMGLPIGLIGTSLAALVLGASTITFYLVWTDVEQELVPRQLLGRVVSIDDLGGFALQPFASGIAGIATDAIGAPLFFIIGGIFSVVVTLIGLALPSIRKLD